LKLFCTCEGLDGHTVSSEVEYPSSVSQRSGNHARALLQQRQLQAFFRPTAAPTCSVLTGTPMSQASSVLHSIWGCVQLSG